jgi:hypothetical protein
MKGRGITKGLKSRGKILVVVFCVSLAIACGGSGNSGGSDNSQYCYNASGSNDANNNLCSKQCEPLFQTNIPEYSECLWNCYADHGCASGCYGDCLHQNCYGHPNYTDCAISCNHQCPD